MSVKQVDYKCNENENGPFHQIQNDIKAWSFLSNVLLEYQATYKYLGIVLDSHFELQAEI